jgi:transketolase
MNDSDILILSKGQATLALYAVLIQDGTYFEEELDSIGQYGSKYSIQADVTKSIKGIYNSAGALGHGLPFACGIALAKKVKKEKGIVYVLTGDGEFNEGTMWESLLIAERFNLNNLSIVVDNNDSHKIPTFFNKVHSFSCDSYGAKFYNVYTERGAGCPSMMKGQTWFHKAPNDAELAALCKEIDEQ